MQKRRDQLLGQNSAQSIGASKQSIAPRESLINRMTIKP